MLLILITPGRVSVLVHRSLQFRLVEVKTDRGGRYVLLNAYIANIAFVMVGLHLLHPADISLLYSSIWLVRGTYCIDCR